MIRDPSIRRHLRQHGVMFLHASSARLPEGAALFLGRSTAGKSTIARLLAPEFPTLADDVVAVRHTPDGGWEVRNGYPWVTDLLSRAELSGLTALLEAKDYHRLAACYYLDKGPAVSLTPLSDLAICQRLAAAITEVLCQGRMTGSLNACPDAIAEDVASRRFWFATVAAISRRVPGAQLTFPPDERVRAFFRDGGG